MKPFWLISILIACGVAVGQSAPNRASRPAPPLVQTLELQGDRLAGFTRSCVLIREDGQFHREVMHQESEAGRPSPDWRSPEVFEGQIDPSELRDLKEILEDNDFRTLTGTLGRLTDFRSLILMMPGGVTPHENLGILLASVAHASGPQAFEILAPATVPSKSFRRFNRWIADVGKPKDGRISDLPATGCALSSQAGAGQSSLTKTRLFPVILPSPVSSSTPNKKDTTKISTAKLHIWVGFDGNVSSIEMVHGAGPTLDPHAVAEVKKWKFSPALLVGVPVPVPLDVEVKFHQ